MIIFYDHKHQTEFIITNKDQLAYQMKQFN
jgi:hypothetical protein